MNGNVDLELLSSTLGILGRTVGKLEETERDDGAIGERHDDHGASLEGRFTASLWFIKSNLFNW